MTLNELIERLEALREEIVDFTGKTEDEAGASEVFIAYQPNYPLQASLRSITAMPFRAGGGREESTPEVVYLGSGERNAYAPAEAWEDQYVVEHDDDPEYRRD